MELTKENWSLQDQKEYTEYLKSLAEDKYQSFHSSLVPGVKVIGIRAPVLKETAKKIAKGNYKEFLSLPCGDTNEERSIYGLVIGYAVKDYDEFTALLKDFVPLINSWAVCDCCTAAFKIIKKHLAEFKPIVEEYLKSDEEYVLRFAAVILLDYYIDEEYIDFTLSKLKEIKSDKYYVNMAVAWAISVCYVKFRDKTLKLLKTKELDIFVQNKAIQKIRESFRVSDEDKEMLKKYKK